MSKVITQHTLVPKHKKLSEKDKEQLLKKHNLSFYSLPKILKADPAIVALDVKAGDIIKIERKSLTAGVAYYYRVVVDE